jgi:hypothetical protein
LNPFLVYSSFFIGDLIPISPHIGTLGMSAQRKRDIRQKSLEAAHLTPNSGRILTSDVVLHQELLQKMKCEQ